MYTVWSFFTRKRNFSYLILSALVIAGLFSVISIQKESNPEVKIPIGIVTTTLAGASASDIETLITNEIERALAGSLEDVQQITSISREGVSSITVEFNANANIDKSIQDLRDEVDTVVPELPGDANDPVVFQVDFSRDPVISFAVAGDLPPSEFAKLGRALEDELKLISSVSDVSISGFRERETQVVVRAEDLNTYGISLNDVTNAISRTNATLPVGSIQFDGVIYNLQFEADISDPSEINDIAIISLPVSGTRKTSQPIFVRDVAFVSDGLARESTFARVSVDGLPSQPALSFNVFKQGGGNITDITAAVNERLDELQGEGELLEGMEVLTIFDSGEFLIDDLTILSTSGLLAVILVMVILFLTLGWRESLVAGLSIPLSFMIGFIGLLASGNTLNFVSLFSLILSVGILVDSAIVIVEGIHSNMKQWMEKKDAALKAIRDFHLPITAGTMTTIAVFAPLFFISGIVGEFIKSIPFTIILVLLASLLVALGFIPLVASLVLRRRITSPLEEKQEIYTKRALDWYKSKLSLIIGNTSRENIFLAGVIGLFFATPVLPIKGLFAAIFFAIVVGVALYFLLKKKLRWYLFMPGIVLTLAVSGLLIAFIPPLATMQVEFFPGGDEDFLIVEMELPEGTTLDRSEIEARKIEEILYTEPQIESFVMTVGASSAFSGTGSSGSKLSNAFIQLRDDRDQTSGEVADVLSDKLSAIKTSEVRVTELSNGPPVGTPVVVTFKGDNLDQLEQLAVEAARILRTVEDTNAVTTSTKDDNTEFVLTIDKAKATALGLDPTAIARTLRTAVQGVEATTINTPEQDIDVIVKQNLNPSFRDPHDTNQITPDVIRQIQIPTASGSVLLGSVLEVGVRKGSTSIRHEDERRVATAASGVADGGNVAEINREFSRRAETELVIPQGVEMIVGGENEETDQSFAEMGYAVIAGLVLMFAIIVLMFNSFRHALYVIAPAFLSFIGIALGLTLTGNALSFPSLMGLIALVGIVVNNSIILIDVMNKLRHQHPDWGIDQIVLEGAASRLRPIVLTTLTTVIGIIPLLFASSLWAPLALSIITGLSFAVIITLLMIPVIYHRNPGTLHDGNGDEITGAAEAPQILPVAPIQ